MMLVLLNGRRLGVRKQPQIIPLFVPPSLLPVRQRKDKYIEENPGYFPPSPILGAVALVINIFLLTSVLFIE
jgi:hypothetical protein